MAHIRTTLTPEDRERLVVIRNAPGASQQEIAMRLGITSGGLSTWLKRRGLGWPISPTRIAALLALPVSTFEDRRKTREAEKRDLIRYRPKDYDGSYPGDPLLSYEEVLSRRTLARIRREAYELHWLRTEARRYALPRMGLPLSRMAL